MLESEKVKLGVKDGLDGVIESGQSFIILAFLNNVFLFSGSNT